jgi:hypothetical protein
MQDGTAGPALDGDRLDDLAADRTGLGVVAHAGYRVVSVNAAIMRSCPTCSGSQMPEETSRQVS